MRGEESNEGDCSRWRSEGEGQECQGTGKGGGGGEGAGSWVHADAERDQPCWGGGRREGLATRPCELGPPTFSQGLCHPGRRRLQRTNLPAPRMRGSTCPPCGLPSRGSPGGWGPKGRGGPTLTLLEAPDGHKGSVISLGCLLGGGGGEQMEITNWHLAVYRQTRPGLQSRLCHQGAESTSALWGLGLLICKMGLIFLPSSGRKSVLTA